MKIGLDNWVETEADGGMGEQCPELLRAVSQAYECGRQVLNLLMSFSNMRHALTLTMKMFANMDKPAV